MFELVLVTRYLIDEPEILVLSGHVKYFTTVIRLGSINRGSIFAMSKSREEARVSVHCRVSDSVDASPKGNKSGIISRLRVLPVYLSPFISRDLYLVA
jgi:hypothetical protein